MNGRRWLWLALLGLAALAPSPLHAQYRQGAIPSHVELPPAPDGDIDPADRARAFSERLLQARGQGLTQDLLKDPRLRDQLELLKKTQPRFNRQDAQSMLNDPQF